MKIQGRKSSQVGSLGPLGVSAPPVENNSTQEARPASHDEVDLSSSQQLKQLSAAIQAMPSVRTEKMDGLRGAIEDGSYYVESDKLARKVVNEVLSEALLNQMQGKLTF